MRHLNAPYRGLRLLLLFLAFIAAASAAVMWLWNAVLAIAVDGVRPLTYWQALGLLVLARLLFGGFRFGSPYSGHKSGAKMASFREKWMHMTPEERQRFKEAWKERCAKR